MSFFQFPFSEESNFEFVVKKSREFKSTRVLQSSKKINADVNKGQSSNMHLRMAIT